MYLISTYNNNILNVAQIVDLYNLYNIIDIYIYINKKGRKENVRVLARGIESLTGISTHLLLLFFIIAKVFIK